MIYRGGGLEAGVAVELGGEGFYETGMGGHHEGTVLCTRHAGVDKGAGEEWVLFVRG